MSNFIEVVYKGKWTSTNDLRNKHWRSNQGLKNKMRSTYKALILEQNPQPMKQFRVHVRFNSRIDTDNVTLKFFLDALKDAKVIVDDNKKFNRGLHIEPDETLEFNTYVVRVTEL
jgi:hypothetical protein